MLRKNTLKVLSSLLNRQNLAEASWCMERLEACPRIIVAASPQLRFLLDTPHG